APPAPFLPPWVHGQPVVVIGACYAGSVEAGEQVIAPLRRVGGALGGLVPPTPDVSHPALFHSTAPHGLGYYWKSEYVPSLSDALIDTLAERAWTVATPESYTIIFHLGGAVGRQDPEGSAFEDRRAAHAVNIDAVWSEPGRASARMAWTSGLWDAVRPHSTGRVYVNFLGEEGQDRVRAAYGDAKYERLRALKRQYDPTNFFRLNQNIRP